MQSAKLGKINLIRQAERDNDIWILWQENESSASLWGKGESHRVAWLT